MNAASGPFSAASPILFHGGPRLLYHFTAGLGLFLQFETIGDGTLPIQLEAKVGEYLALTMKLIRLESAFSCQYL